MNIENCRVRFAPSPTGYLHIGSARTALFNWLFARRHGGTFVLRIEDTDQKRNTPEALAAITEGLSWLDLMPDEGPDKEGEHGPYYQSQRQGIYEKYVARLKETDGIYPCFCTKERLADLRKQKQDQAAGAWGYDGHCRDLDPADVKERLAAGDAHTWRLKVSRPGKLRFDDMILGPNEVDHADIEDIVLIRPDGTPTYNLAVVIDDHDMAITHVIRGQDHLTNTFKQILIYESLGWTVPTFAHISLILAPPPNKGKLSKRHGGAEVMEYQARGYLPEALVNFLALIGWSYGEDREILSRQELVDGFDMAHASKSHARLNPSKLDAISGHRIREMPAADVAAAIAPYLHEAGILRKDAPEDQDKLALIADFAAQRISYFSQAPELVDWITGDVAYEKKARKALRTTEGAPDFLKAYAAALPAELPGPDALEAQARDFVAQRDMNFGHFAKAVRAALTGRMTSPPLFHCVLLLGQEKAAARLEQGAAKAQALQSGE